MPLKELNDEEPSDCLMRALWAASSQGMQDDLGAKSANRLCN